MAYYQSYSHYQEPEVLIASNVVYGYGQPTGNSDGSKTPASMINHSGHSPGPLSTPSLSRNASQGPEALPDYAEQMVYDDPGNLSDSPTSVKTPDDDTNFEDLMLDSSTRDYYQNQNGAMTTQVSQGGLTAPQTNMFLAAQGAYPDQVLQDTINATFASQPLQFQAQFTMQGRPLQNTFPSQPHSNYFGGQNYTSQPPRQDPWNGQGPMRNPNLPRSGMAVFDPVTDPVPQQIDLSTFVNDVDYWTMNNTDPNYLISPNDPAPPQDVFPTAQQIFQQRQQRQQPQQQQSFMQPQNQQQIQNSSPIEMRLTTASPKPDSQGFVNFNSQSPLFTNNYITDSVPSSLITSIEQAPNSPMASASSPGGSEGMFSSYQQSDPGMVLDPYSNEAFDTQFLPPPSPVRPSPNRSIPEVTFPEVIFDFSPEPEHQTSRRSGASKPSGRPGGRALGTHLDAKVAKAAHDMRKTVACWHCVLQRDKCGPGDICERCLKRSQRPNADCGLGCSRIKLIELAQYFLPMLIMQIHEDTHLTHFVTQFIQQWNNQEIILYMTCSQKAMPRIPVKVYEFAPRGKELLEQIQYQTDKKTGQRIAIKKESPALGMVHINHNEEKKYDKYISDIVDNHLDAFADVCWADDDNDFMPRLFKLMTRVKPKNEDEQKLLREVNRLIVCTYIMSHTLTIAEETKHQTLSKMHSYTHAGAYVQNYTSPRMTNRQLKYFFARLQRSILSAVLNKLQQIFKSSKGCDKWIAAFVAVTGMAMAHEDQQATVHQVMQTRAISEGWDVRDAQAQADIACREIDARMNFVSQIFRWKYNRKCNPIRDAEHDWEKEVGFGDESSVTFVRSVAQLVRENSECFVLSMPHPRELGGVDVDVDSG
ncbi:hypothetical protein K458DRAFT_28082 [Lentithecium fluviatile CBS 122367]|uniref:Uncharacterized protein n=1 Tax=Lentithecium fluviatile CBS 122367 TaxID=1168545 RepID=A0A6G1J324_9PLEO|nr:hypothetical protein K458DRAFT_28082 [Lentithecium fluviatile CBS 122367]